MRAVPWEEVGVAEVSRVVSRVSQVDRWGRLAPGAQGGTRQRGHLWEVL